MKQTNVFFFNSKDRLGGKLMKFNTLRIIPSDYSCYDSVLCMDDQH